jgi:hypothetical protein
MTRKPFGLVERIVYVTFCILSLGSFWVIKIVIQKAISDAID